MHRITANRAQGSEKPTGVTSILFHCFYILLKSHSHLHTNEIKETRTDISTKDPTIHQRVMMIFK